MRRITTILMVLTAAGCASQTSLTSPAFHLREGDLLFQDLDGSPLCDAIEKVTDGVNGADFSHVGIVCHSRSGSVRVIEAGPLV